MTLFDRVITGLDSLVSRRTSTATVHRGDTTHPGTSPSYPGDAFPQGALDDVERRDVVGMMRVNHAGEIAAQGLYEGHALVARTAAQRDHMRLAASEEARHLAWCHQRLTELDAHPSRLAPVWYTGSVAIGAVAGLAGDRWSLGFVAETERQVVTHLDAHLARLPDGDARSRAILRQMRDDEARHGQEAQSQGAATLPLPVRALMQLTSKVMTTSAYWV
ncbi:MAG: 2-polyprenyl-3-methyl-6-methoxy-1,4-benzoquinone monooxygenase [Pseudomonadota bacterium]